MTLRRALSIGRVLFKVEPVLGHEIPRFQGPKQERENKHFFFGFNSKVTEKSY